MTRINVGVSPQELPDKLLLAEHREITRVPNAVKTGRAVIKDLPERFTLGTGHVKFFYNKLTYLQTRYESLYDECRRRSFNVTNKSSAFLGLPPECLNDYTPTPSDRNLIKDRIASKGFSLLPLSR